MLITDKELLSQYTTEKRLWQGIPSIEVTKKGKTFLTFYSGGTKEEIGNFAVLTVATDGKHFSEPVAVAYAEGNRCFDPCLWIDPLGRLWFTWAQYPDEGTYAVICDDPDAEVLSFGDVFCIGRNVMMCKPTVLDTGEWIFPLAVWHDNMTAGFPGFGESIPERGAYAYVTNDHGKTFQKLGYTALPDRSFDEHQFLQLKDGRIRMFVRTRYGIGAADSFDGGKSWCEGFDTGYGGPSSRFFVRRLASGRVLLINHYDFTKRNNLTAMLSEDDGKTFPYRLLLDGRSNVSYPDATQTEDGRIHLTYDRERGAFKTSWDAIFTCAREILTACITEDDILNGSLVSQGSYLQRVASRLTDYTGPISNPFNEETLFNDSEYAKYLSANQLPQLTIETLFNVYNLNCTNLHSDPAQKLDSLVSTYLANGSLSSLCAIIALLRSLPKGSAEESDDLVTSVRDYICCHMDQNHSVDEIAKQFNISANYLMHIFKQRTGTTIVGFRNAQRLIKAKLLIRGSQDSITQIAQVCGYDSPSYFTEFFKKETGMSPTQYRKLSVNKKEETL